MMYKMLEKHYEKRFSQSKTPLVSSIDYDFSQKISGSGWYYREILERNGRSFRWTGPGTISTLDFPLKRKEDLKILFHVFLAASPDILASVQLQVNNKPIPLKVAFMKKAERYIEGTIPKSLLSERQGFTRLSFHINKTINPHSKNIHDPMDRKIGLALDRIKIVKVAGYDAKKEVITIDHSFNAEKQNKKFLAKLNRISKQNQELIMKQTKKKN